MKIETEHNHTLIFKQEIDDSTKKVSGNWIAAYIKDGFEFDFEFNEILFEGRDIDSAAITYAVKKILGELKTLHVKSSAICKAFYETALSELDTNKNPFELSSIEVVGIWPHRHLENAYGFFIEMHYFQTEDYYASYITVMEFNSPFFSLKSVKRI